MDGRYSPIAREFLDQRHWPSKRAETGPATRSRKPGPGARAVLRRHRSQPAIGLAAVAVRVGFSRARNLNARDYSTTANDAMSPTAPNLCLTRFPLKSRLGGPGPRGKQGFPAYEIQVQFEIDDEDVT